jgi:hypothetical protein
MEGLKKNGQHFISPRFYFSHQRNWFSVNRFFFPPWLFATHCWNKRKTIVLYSIRVLYILPRTGICWLFVCWIVFSRQLFFSATNSSMQRSGGIYICNRRAIYQPCYVCTCHQCPMKPSWRRTSIFFHLVCVCCVSCCVVSVQLFLSLYVCVSA